MRRRDPGTSDLWLPDGRINRTYVPDYADVVLAYTEWFQDDFLGGIRGMNGAEIATYTVLLNEMYARGVALSRSARSLARQCGLSQPTYERALAALIEDGKLIELDAGIWQERVERVLILRLTKHKAASEAGKLSGKKRRKNSGAAERAFNERSTDDEPDSATQRLSKEIPAESLKTTTTTREADDFLTEVMHAAGILGPPIPTYWAAPDAIVRVSRWQSDLGLTRDQILEGIRHSRSHFTEQPRGPMAFQRAMVALSGALREPAMQPRLRAVGGGARPPPPEIDYEALFASIDPATGRIRK